MKNLLILIFAFTSVSTMNSQNIESTTTTYYLIRHAEKDRTNSSDKNPSLTEKGLQRAKKWSEILKNIPFDFIYSTNYKRTIQTATPTAENNHLKILIYNPLNFYTQEFKNKTEGKNILIVGHSNTTPFLVNKILGKNKYAEIDDTNNANLYIVTVSKNNKIAVLLTIE